MQDQLPVRPAIAGTVDAALGVAPEGMPKCRRIHQVGILRVAANLGDLAGLFQAEMLPAAPGVGGFVDAIADGDIDADGGLARAGIDDIGVGGRHFQRADGRGGEVAVADILPVLPGVGGLPDAATDAAEVEGIRIARVASDSDDASAAEGSDAAELG